MHAQLAPAWTRRSAVCARTAGFVGFPCRDAAAIRREGAPPVHASRNGGFENGGMRGKFWRTTRPGEALFAPISQVWAQSGGMSCPPPSFAARAPQAGSPAGSGGACGGAPLASESGAAPRHPFSTRAGGARAQYPGDCQRPAGRTPGRSAPPPARPAAGAGGRRIRNAPYVGTGHSAHRCPA